MWLAKIIGFVTAVIIGSLVNYATRKISGGIQRVANAMANWLYDQGYPSLARTVRHFGRFVVWLGRTTAKLYTVYGDITRVVDVEQVVDDVEVGGRRYTLVGPSYYR